MKRRWLALAARIDALSLRERVLVFAAAAAVLVFAAWLAGLGPLLRKQATLRSQVSQQQNNLIGLNAEIQQKIQAYQLDPDAPVRARLQAVSAESAKLGDSLRAMQKGLVAPERMGPLIDAILRANGRLQLVSMRTLPVTSLNEPMAQPGADAKPSAGPDAAADTQAKLASVKAAMAAETAKMAAPAVAAVGAAARAAAGQGAQVKAGSLLYRHGVEITVRGSYLDMIDYMNALETLPTQLFWGGARLEVEDYPTSRLTLTLYTLSLDSKWLKL